MRIDAPTMLVFVLVIDAVLFLGGTAIADISGGSNSFYGYNGTLIQEADSGVGDYQVSQVTEDEIPGSTNSVDPDTGGFFTDIFRSVRNWILSTTGVAYVLGFINAFPNFLAALGLPVVVTFTLGAIWHILGLFALASFIWGR
jgi:hypothetical protein